MTRKIPYVEDHVQKLALMRLGFRNAPARKHMLAVLLSSVTPFAPSHLFGFCSASLLSREFLSFQRNVIIVLVETGTCGFPSFSGLFFNHDLVSLALFSICGVVGAYFPFLPFRPSTT